MHRPTGETVLLYGFTDPNRTREIQFVLVQMGIRVKMLHAEDLGQKVGYLAGVKGVEETENPETYEAPQKEVLIMHNFSINRRVDLMLSNIKARGLAGIPLKCIVTAHNKNWTLYDLIGELEKEHAALTAGEAALQAKEEK